MNEVGAITMRRTANKPLKRRISGAVMTALAVFVTLWPVFITGLWVYNTFLYEPRKVVALAALEQPRNVRLFDEPLVSVTFDDSWESSYRNGAPILQKYGIPTTQYVLPGSFNDPAYLSESQVTSLQAAGHDIQSHSVSHQDLKRLSAEQLEKELRDSRQQLSRLLNKEVQNFSAPYSSFDARVTSRMQAYYYSQRNTYADIRSVGDEDVNLRTTFDPYSITAFAVRRDTSVEDIEAFLAYAKARKAWALLVYHEVGNTSDSMFNVSPHQLDDQMAAVKKSGVKAATVSQVMDDYNSRLQREE